MARSEIRRANQVKVRALPTFPASMILLRKLIFCDKIIAQTDVLRQPSPPSSSFFFLHRTKNIVIYQNKKFGGKKFLRRWSDFFQGSTLFIDEDIRLSHSNSQLPQRSRFVSCNLRHIESTRYQSSMPRDLIHHDSSILFIKLPAVRQPRCIQSNSQRHLDCSPAKYK